ncbi:anthranilate phosphoribosyltransferase [Botryobacter ruber]|uniref:anthranilate phosphoribosyltransferase n=1 Tax=Botryobacter ruber TaxID=2171629 RepID=UPI000E0AB2C1|nr:anthranilate phosphoribosyltransferase [Botryobacter ruber]
MEHIKAVSDNPLLEGIKVIGIGKHGSKPLPGPQIEEIFNYLSDKEVIAIQKGAFYGSLVAKNPTVEEQKLFKGKGNGAEAIYKMLCQDAPADMKATGVKLLSKETLNADEARILGNFLFSDLPGEAFRGMAASMLRMRYETDAEYQGLMEAAIATYSPSFRAAPPLDNNLVQLAEPFDGVEHSYMITPILAHVFQEAGYPVVVSMGRSAGPKYALNTLDIYKELEAPFLQQNSDLAKPAPKYGWALDQQVLSPALDQWVDRRRLIFKRPFLATLEKVLNPCHAGILVTSVFHITYIDKMITLAGMAGFSGVIVLKRGLEGTLVPSIAKASGITCAVRQPDGSFLTQSFDATHEIYSDFRAEADAVVEHPAAAANADLIRSYISQGATGNEDFDKRVNLAIALYQQGLEWIRNNSPAAAG